jgi:hypothetical protein
MSRTLPSQKLILNQTSSIEKNRVKETTNKKKLQENYDGLGGLNLDPYGSCPF